mgnify:CR=1 FL=1|tara:strand:- start:77343 stop:78473 length:1131 start_codon:yes stop_codon:yes gene_type:complete
MKGFIFAVLLICTPFCFAGSSVTYYGNTPVLKLSGSYLQMGQDYGQDLRFQLNQALSVLKKYYINESHLTYPQLVQQANLLYNRFPNNLQQFMQGEAQGSGLTLDDVKILNAMETFNELLEDAPRFKCAFVFLPASHTTTNSTFIGRNYDYSPPLNTLAQYLTVTILNDGKSVPTAFISIAGEIYCPSCVNAKGVFMELNDGSASGGSKVQTSRASMLSGMLTTLQHSNDLSQANQQLKQLDSDFSLIVNAADEKQSDSFEYSTTLGQQHYSSASTLISTNYFLDPAWGSSIPKPNNISTALGITRRNHLLNLTNNTSPIDIAQFKTLMAKRLLAGGAAWDFTVYQLIYDTSTQALYVRYNHAGDWTAIPMKALFK